MKVELLRYGAVTEDEAGVLTVRRREIIPKEFDERLVTSMAFSLRALATTVAFNTDPNRKGAGRIERFVQSQSLREESRVALTGTVRERIVLFTQELDDLFSDGEIESDGPTRRIGVGVYFHED
jgi:hypothetical protein